jgi:hypothetical protein
VDRELPKAEASESIMTNEHLRNLGEIYLPAMSLVLSMEIVVGKLLMSRM